MWTENDDDCDNYLHSPAVKTTYNFFCGSFENLSYDEDNHIDGNEVPVRKYKSSKVISPRSMSSHTTTEDKSSNTEKSKKYEKQCADEKRGETSSSKRPSKHKDNNEVNCKGKGQSDKDKGQHRRRSRRLSRSMSKHKVEATEDVDSMDSRSDKAIYLQVPVL